LTGGHPLAFPLTFCGSNLFDNGWRSWIFVFFRLLLQFNYLRGSGKEAVVEGFLIFGYEPTRTVQIPATSDQVRTRKFGKLHESIHTMTVPLIEPIFEEWRQRGTRKSILEDKLTVNVPANWRTWEGARMDIPPQTRKHWFKYFED
jgi:hypothetical protein